MDEESGSEFLDLILPMLKELNVIDTPSDEKIVQFLQPDELEAKLNLQLSDASRPRSHQALVKLCRDFIRYSVKTSHRGFYNQLYGGIDPYGLAGSWITEALNTSQYTFEVAPCFVLAERAVINRAKRLFGGSQWADGDGLFCPGGSYSNMLALALARDNAPINQRAKINFRGLNGVGEMAVYTSEQSHYSLSKSCALLGIGKDNLIKVKCDENGSMDISSLENLLKNGTTSNFTKGKQNGANEYGLSNGVQNQEDGSQRVPIMVNATAGTTVRGAFDDLEKIADVCKKYNIWMHVDACWGGSLMLSNQHKYLLKGIERADSISWNPHKMLGAPLQCSMLLVKKKGLLHKCNSLGADYLFQPDKYYDVSYDTGDMTIQCGRKTDAFKLLLMWLARGEESLSERVDNCMECCQYLRERVRTRPGYIPVSEGEQNKCTNVCFWYVPESMRDQERTEEFWDKIHRVTSIIKKKLVMNGTLMIGYAPLPAKIQKSTSKPEKHSQHNLKHKSSCPQYINTQNYIKSTDINGTGVNKCFNNNFAANRREIIVQNVRIDTTKNVDVFDTKIPEIRITDSHLTNGKIINDDLDYIKDLNTKTNGKFNENEDELKQTVSHDGLTQTDLTVEENGDQQIHIINLLNIQNNGQTHLQNGFSEKETALQESENILNLDVQNGFSDVGNSDNKLNRVLQDKAQDTTNLTFNTNSLNQLNIMNSLPKDNLVSDLTENGAICTCQESLVTKKVNAFRIVNTCHPPPTYNDMLFILREIERVGHDIVI